MARQPVREPRDVHDRRSDDKKPSAKAEPVVNETKADDSVKKDETSLDDKPE